jgi:hypothetical protein
MKAEVISAAPVRKVMYLNRLKSWNLVGKLRQPVEHIVNPSPAPPVLRSFS